MRRVRADESPELYYLSSVEGRKLPGSYYKAQIRRVGKDDLRGNLPIEKVLKTKEVNGKVLQLVSFKNFNDKKFNRWVEKPTDGQR